MEDDDDQHPGGQAPERDVPGPGRAGPGRPLGPDERGQRLVRRTLVTLPLVALAATAGTMVASTRAGWSLWQAGLATIVVGLLVVVAGLWLVVRFSEKVAGREQARFRQALAVWARRRGWQVHAGSGADGHGAPYPEHVRAEAVEAVACDQVIEGRERGRAVRIESWQVRYRVPGSPGTFPRQQQLLRLAVDYRLPVWMLLPSERTSYAIPASLRDSPLMPGPQGTAIVDPEGISAQFDGALHSFAYAVRTTGAHALWTAGEVVLLFPSDAIPCIQEYRMGLAHHMADVAAQVAGRRSP